MSYELRIERLYDATPEQVFDAFVDPATQEQLHGAGQEGWTVQRCETDVRVGGTSTYAMGFNGVEPDVEVRVFSVVDRPRRLVFRHSMTVTEWGGRTVETEMTITFEDAGRQDPAHDGADRLRDRRGPRRLQQRLAHLPRHARAGGRRRARR